MNRLKQLLRPLRRKLRAVSSLNPLALRRELDTLYGALYAFAHDLDRAADFSSMQTRAAFAHQWESHKQGRFLLTDPWFRENVTRILTEEELLIKPEWFAGKRVLDAGCGNGRWSYGFSKLGADVTAVDVNQVAIEETRRAIQGFDNAQAFHVTPLEQLSTVLEEQQFDLVFCWGVAHHCGSYNQAVQELARRVKPDGILYMYLYGRETIPLADDVDLFKERLRYNLLTTEQERYAFLLKKARGDRDAVHNVHDIYAPLINRRLEYAQVKEALLGLGFEDVERTIAHSEVFVRAIRSGAKAFRDEWSLPPSQAPYWFERKA